MVTSSSSSKARSSGPVLRSLSPGGRFCNSPSLSSSTSAFASSSSFYSSSSTFRHDNHRDFRSHHHQPRSTSPSRVNVYSSPSLTPSVRFFIDNRSSSPNRSAIVSRKNRPVSNVKRTCMCSPTTHPGSFRCSLHKNVSSSGGHSQAASFPSTRLNMWRSAMANSIVRIGGVEGELVKRALTTLIRPSSHQQRRRAAFQPRSSRLSVIGTESARRVLYAEGRVRQSKSFMVLTPLDEKFDPFQIRYVCSVGIPSVPFVVIFVPVVSRVAFTPFTFIPVPGSAAQ
ncbi:unnamed protein product [Citrullus colocynthis]|uniref:Serine-rich protein-like protein n=1 Tax=Citrullus colocynthis TaxID=252529 RepID=A0ABP0YD48_9ROSI